MYAVDWVSSCANLTGGHKVLTLGLVKGEEDDRAVVVKFCLVEERNEPEVEPVPDKVDRGVVAELEVDLLCVAGGVGEPDDFQ